MKIAPHLTRIISLVPVSGNAGQFAQACGQMYHEKRLHSVRFRFWNALHICLAEAGLVVQRKAHEAAYSMGRWK